MQSYSIFSFQFGFFCSNIFLWVSWVPFWLADATSISIFMPYSIVWICHSLSYCWWTFFQILAVKHSATLNILVYTFCFTYTHIYLSIYLKVELLGIGLCKYSPKLENAKIRKFLKWFCRLLASVYDDIITNSCQTI